MIVIEAVDSASLDALMDKDAYEKHVKDSAH